MVVEEEIVGASEEEGIVVAFAVEEVEEIAADEEVAGVSFLLVSPIPKIRMSQIRPAIRIEQVYNRVGIHRLMLLRWLW